MSAVSELKKRIARIEAAMEAAAAPARRAVKIVKRSQHAAETADIARRERMRKNPKNKARSRKKVLHRTLKRTVTVLRANPKNKTFRVFAKQTLKGKDKFYYWTGGTFDSNYTLAVTYSRDEAIKAARSFSRNYPYATIGVSDGKA